MRVCLELTERVYMVAARLPRFGIVLRACQQPRRQRRQRLDDKKARDEKQKSQQLLRVTEQLSIVGS